MADPTNTPSLDGASLRKAQVERAFDVIAADRGRDAAIAAMTPVLRAAGYPHADYLERILNAYLAKREKTGGAPATAADLDRVAAELVAAVTGEAATAGATGSPEDERGDSDASSDEASHDDPKSLERTARAGETPAEADPADNHKETAAGDDAGERGETAPNSPTKDTTQMTQTDQNQAQTTDSGAFEASGLAAVQIADASKVDKMLATASGKRVKSIQTVIDTLKGAEETVAQQEEQIARAEQALTLIDQDDLDGAQAIEIGQPITAKPSGIAEIDLSEDHADFVDAALEKTTGGEIETYGQLIASLTAAETRASENAERLRELRRDIKAKGPKPKAKAAVTNAAGQAVSELDCEVVYRKASEIFTDAFGHSAPILDFEIPTLEWAGEPHPDIPEKIDSFRFYAPVLAKSLYGLKAGKISWLMGETGCGKSEFWAQVAARIGFPYIRMNMDSHLTRADLIGASRLVPGESGQPVMTFVEGIIPRALQMPCILLIDEFDLGDPEIMPVIQPVLEGKGVRLLEDGGRYVKPHELCTIAATGNTNGLGSDNNVYLNAHEQSGATRDRIAMYIDMPYLPADKEHEVVMARIPHADSDFAEKMIQLANKTRESYRLGDMGQLISTRHVLDAVDLHAHNAPLYQDDEEVTTDTLEVTVLNFMDANARSVTRGFIDAIFA